MTIKIFLPSYRSILQFLIILSAATLISVYIAEYFFSFKPCILCIYQRVPYFIILAVSGVGTLINADKLSKYLCYICSMLFFAGFLIALYHTSIEHGVISEPTSCSTSSSYKMSMDDIRKSIYESTISCKNVEMRILGFSAAEINTIVSFTIFIYLLISISKIENSTISQYF